MAAAAMDLPTFADVLAAHERIQGAVRRTPVMNNEEFDARCDRRVYFKCENLQVGGAFKFRGATNAVRHAESNGWLQQGMAVATHSSGNHGAAVARAAQARGFAAVVVMPEDSAAPKFAAVERAGGQVIRCKPGLAAREATLASWLVEHSAFVVHPFDSSQVIAGQGTAAVELLVDCRALDVLTMPVGGGGLVGGSALAARALAPHCKVIAAEPAAADDAYQSFYSGQRVAAGIPTTIADGLRGALGMRNFALLRAHVDAVVTVSEAEIIAAMRCILQDLKLLIEPSSAVPVAALLAGKIGAAGQRVGVILSGGNVDLQACPFLAGDK